MGPRRRAGELLARRSWTTRAACRADAVTFDRACDAKWQSKDNAAIRAAKAVCAGCDVRPECLAAALERGEHGVWGGLSERERRTLHGRGAA